MEISFAACGLSSQTVLVISIEKRWRPMLIITRPCFVAIGAACCGCSGKGVGLVGIVVPLVSAHRHPCLRWSTAAPAETSEPFAIDQGASCGESAVNPCALNERCTRFQTAETGVLAAIDQLKPKPAIKFNRASHVADGEGHSADSLNHSSSYNSGRGAYVCASRSSPSVPSASTEPSTSMTL